MTPMRPEILVALLALLIVVLYAVFAGADFGGGVWDLFASGPRKVEQRAAVGAAMSPVWETNHVWLIYLVVLLFTCFPPLFAELGERLFLPMTLALFGIVFRGAAFAFRGPADRDLIPHRISGFFFGAASIGTPFLLGACAAAIATGTFDWTRPMALAVGLFAIALCAQLAAVYLCVETTGQLREDFRRRAYAATLVVAATGLVALLVGRSAEPVLLSHLLAPGPLAIVAAAMALGAGVFVLLIVKQVRLARVTVALEVTAVLCGWYAAQAPYVATQLGLSAPVAPEATVVGFLWISLAGAIVLVPSLLLLFAVFKRTPINVD
jgi:cytochrome d ubiquinol oxidase subunit II